MKRYFPVLLCIVVIALGWGLVAPAASYTVQSVLSSIFDGTDAINVNFNQSAVTGALTSGSLAVDTDVLSVVAATDVVEVNGFLDQPYQVIDAATYTLNAASKANMYVVKYTDTGAAGITLATAAAVDGRTITIKDGELNASANNITVGTEGAETIDEAGTYAMNADGESVTLLSDGTNWFVLGAYLE